MCEVRLDSKVSGKGLPEQMTEKAVDKRAAWLCVPSRTPGIFTEHCVPTTQAKQGRNHPDKDSFTGLGTLLP